MSYRWQGAPKAGPASSAWWYVHEPTQQIVARVYAYGPGYAARLRIGSTLQLFTSVEAAQRAAERNFSPLSAQVSA